MAVGQLHRFFEAFDADAAMRRRLEAVIAFAGPRTDAVVLIGDFVSANGFTVDTGDLMTIDIAIDGVGRAAPQKIVRHLHVFALDYLRGFRDPRRYNRLGVYDPQNRQLWRAF